MCSPTWSGPNSSRTGTAIPPASAARPGCSTRTGRLRGCSRDAQGRAAMMLCRACAGETASPRCAQCGEEQPLEHAELAQLSIAHLDCDAFYASIEKRD